MATDPNKQLLSDSMAIERAQSDYALDRKQYAKVHHGQIIVTGAGTGIKLSVSDRKVTGSAAVSAPGAPTSVVATAGNAQASVAFVAPASNGGAPITEYSVTSSPGNITARGKSSPIIVPGLTNDTAYTFKVRAYNVTGAGAESAASSAVTPEDPDAE